MKFIALGNEIINIEQIAFAKAERSDPQSGFTKVTLLFSGGAGQVVSGKDGTVLWKMLHEGITKPGG